jgi:uncharacterized damage-inducible protein DinB
MTMRQPKVRPSKARQPQHRQTQAHAEFGRAAIQIFAANERMNQLLIEHLHPAAWAAKTMTAKPPGANPSGKTRTSATRTIAAIFTHMHNVRTKWIRLTAPHLKIPTQLNRTHCAPQQASAGLAESAARCSEMLAEALGGCERDGRDGKSARIEKFVRDGWAKPWPVGPEMLCYMLAHEAHHRGQVCMLAHQLGFPLPINVMSGLWKWEKLWKDCGAPTGPGEDS